MEFDTTPANRVFIVEGGEYAEDQRIYLITQTEEWAIAFARGLFAASGMSWVAMREYQIPYQIDLYKPVVRLDLQR